VRRLLLAALASAGSLLVALPALAQLSNTTSTFSGQVAATCEFNLPENIALTYNSNLNRIAAYEEFELTTNISPARIHASRFVVVNEPPPIASAITPKLFIGDYFNPEWIMLTKGSESMSVNFNFSTTNPNSMWIDFKVTTENRIGERNELPPGNYAYRATISCLQ